MRTVVTRTPEETRALLETARANLSRGWYWRAFVLLAMARECLGEEQEKVEESPSP